MLCNVCGHPVEDRGYKHAQCRFCGQVSNLCCDPEAECFAAAPNLDPKAAAPKASHENTSVSSRPV